jgi:SRSO17 transposase
MSKYPDITPREVGNFYGLRTWVEYGLKQSKNELGWADYRFTRYQDIERWWEIVCSAYLMVSLHSESRVSARKSVAFYATEASQLPTPEAYNCYPSLPI